MHDSEVPYGRSGPIDRFRRWRNGTPTGDVAAALFGVGLLLVLIAATAWFFVV